MEDTDPLLRVTNLKTVFETENGSLPAVDGVSFSIQSGEIYGIVGESGSGKSVTALSLLRLLGSSGNVTADDIWYKGENLLKKSEKQMQTIRGGDISIIFQDPMSSLNPVLSIGEQVAEVVRHHSDGNESTGFLSELKRKYITGTSTQSPSWQRAIELLDTVGIPDPKKRAKEYPHQLSGGMKQRVMIAQSLAGDPDLIIADEPTTALDVTIEAQILDQLVELRDEFNVSIVLITHDLAVVRETCDRVMVMYAGELMETAPTEVLFADPYHPYTQGLLRSIPRVSDDQERLDVIEGTVPSPLDKPKGCPFRNRCAEAFEMCDEPLRSHEGATPGHIVQCHLYDDDAEKNRTETSQRRDGTTDKTSQHEQTDVDSKRKLGRLDNPSEGGIR